MAFTVACAGSYVTVAFSLARLTLASDTPFSPLRADSTLDTQDAQVILVTFRTTFLKPAGASGIIAHRHTTSIFSFKYLHYRPRCDFIKMLAHFSLQKYL